MRRCQSPRYFRHCCGDVLGNAVSVALLQGGRVRDAQGCRKGCSKGCREGSVSDAVQAGSMSGSVHQD